MLEQLRPLMLEAAQLVQIVTEQLQLLPAQESAVQQFRGRIELSRLMIISTDIEALLDRNPEALPTALQPCLRLGGHLAPFLMLLDEATLCTRSVPGNWPQYVQMAKTLAGKIAADVGFMEHTLASGKLAGS
ncbi:MAG: hypothetical protein FJ279_01350 [Planctomycetes bacterium]|nr:hypothetical protein [Planctomycetota bacterium]